jgi:hypothetical protein
MTERKATFGSIYFKLATLGEDRDEIRTRRSQGVAKQRQVPR